MAGGINKVIIVGNLGADPETRTFSNGGKVCNLRVATSESWKDRDSGEKKEKTEWHSVALHGPVADVAEKYLRKGSKVYIEGKLTTRKWTDQQGNDRYSTEIVVQGFEGKLEMLDSKPSGGGNQWGGDTHPSQDGFGGQSSQNDDLGGDMVPF